MTATKTKVFRLTTGSLDSVKRVLAYDVHKRQAAIVFHSHYGPDWFDVVDVSELELTRNGVMGDVCAELLKLADVVTGED